MLSDKSSTTPRILVVEDEAIIALDLKRRLERLGCEVVGVADNGADALALAAQQRPTLVFMDIVIQGRIDGIETAAQLARQMDVPIVFLTAHADEATIQRAKQVGPYGYVVKPFEDRELHTTIEMALYRHQKEARARFSQHAMASASIGISIVDALHAKLGIVECNAALARMTGYSEEEVCERSAGFLLGDNTDPVDAEKFLHALATQEECQLTLQLQRKDGTRFWCDLSLSLVRDQIGTVTHYLCFHSDVTVRRQTEEALQQTTKLEAIGRITAGIVHDFNNSLTVIHAFAGFVRDSLPQVDARRDDIDELLRAASTATGLARQLLTFSRQQPTEKRPIDINESIAACLKMLRRSVGRQITVESTPSPQPAVVRMDPVQIDQILLNLALNARDAMPDGGQLTLEVSCLAAHEALGKGLVRLTVSDTGSGIDPETMARVFEPFFTTKAAGKGTGLGLATCFAILKDAAGSIDIESLVGQGTTFTIEIPMCEEPPLFEDASVLLQRATGKVLVVEDNASLRVAMARMLESAGYVVSQAENGDEAIEQIDEPDSHFDLIVTDLVMPGQGGLAVAEHARRCAPQSKVVFTSGYFEGEAATEPLASQILWKPYSRTSLLSLAHRALAGLQPSRARPAPLKEQTAGGLVLLVEDDESSRKAIARLLRSAGYDVAGVASIAGARELLDTESRYVAILCDLTLEDGSGADLIRWIRAAHPALAGRTMVLTGGVVDDAGRELVEEGLTEVLQKPINPTELLKRVALAAAGAISTNIEA